MAAEPWKTRIREIEDRLEIYNLIASHPPSADTGAGDYTRSVWAEDGDLRPRRRIRQADRPAQAIAATWSTRSTTARSSRASPISPGCPMCGSPAIRRSRSPICRSLCPTGSAPYSRCRTTAPARGFHVHRVAANRWDFVRTPAGWKIKRRRLRALDGSEPAREILRGTFA